ncbi:hypothetical protein AB0451_03565 [Streptomyces sp. NPDC052000]|uniref:hypothetical protein n=1 Tax=Streptomyces sp. NPDC052000 TaxID=3155676 RepID=UPI00344CC98B
MTTPTNPDVPSRLFTTADHRAWLLTLTYQDADGITWQWDQHPYDLVAGPGMTCPELLLHLPLIVLATHCGLHSDTTEPETRGVLLIQIHDSIEAGLPAGGTS